MTFDPGHICKNPVRFLYFLYSPEHVYKLLTTHVAGSVSASALGEGHQCRSVPSVLATGFMVGLVIIISNGDGFSSGDDP